jgi:hypothetical protein
VDPRAGLDDVEKRKFLTLPRLEKKFLWSVMISSVSVEIRCGMVSRQRSDELERIWKEQVAAQFEAVPMFIQRS